MNKTEIEYIHKILYSEQQNQSISEIKLITDSKLLHIIGGNYNWDNGFDIPYSIITNKNCDLGTALMIFYSADGYRILESDAELKTNGLKEWFDFISEVYEMVLNNKFKSNSIKFIPPLTKVQIFKIKKYNPSIEKVFLEESDGETIEIPII